MINGPGNGGGSGGASIGVLPLGSFSGAVNAPATKAITVATGTLTGNGAITVSGIPSGGQMTFALLQDGTGGHTLTINGASTVVNQGPGALTTILVDYDGTNYYVTSLNVGVQTVNGKTGPTVVLAASDVSALGAGSTLNAIGTNNPASASVPFNNQKATGLAPGTAPTDASTLSQAGRRWIRDQIWTGCVDATWDFSSCPQTAAPLVSQKIYGTLAGFLAGDVINNIFVCVQQPGTGTNPTGLFVAVYDTTGVQKAVSANLNANAGWTSAGIKSFPLSAPFTAPSDGAYYLCVLENGLFGTQVVQIVHGSGAAAAAGLTGSVALSVSQTGQATPPTPATFAAANDNYWFGWS